MTLIETLVAAAVLGAMLAVIALGIATIRKDLKHTQVEQLLATLDEAMSAYHKATGEWPANPIAKDAERISTEQESDADRVIAVLAAQPTSQAILDRTKSVFRIKPVPDISAQASQSPWGTVQDAWGQRLRCLTADSTSPIDREAVAANGGRPIFVSAGPDEQFGSQDIAAAADNLRSDQK